MRVGNGYFIIAQTDKPEGKKEEKKVETPKSVSPTFEDKKLTNITLSSGEKGAQLDLKTNVLAVIENRGGGFGCPSHGPNGADGSASWGGSVGVIAKVAADKDDVNIYPSAVKKYVIDPLNEFMKSEDFKKLPDEKKGELRETSKQLNFYYLRLMLGTIKDPIKK